MKKAFLFFFILAAVILFTYCGPSKKATMAVPPPPPAKLSYEAKIAPLLVANCAPCHFPDKGGRKKPLDSYASASAQIDEVLRRIQLSPTDRGFMPDRKPKMADSTIALFKQWKDDGLVK